MFLSRSETTVALSEDEVKAILAEWVRVHHGLAVTAEDVRLKTNRDYADFHRAFIRFVQSEER